MKNQKIWTTGCILSSLLLSSTGFAVTIKGLTESGRGFVEYVLQNGMKEYCILPADNPLAQAKDSDRKDEIKLCSINFEEGAHQNFIGNLGVDPTVASLKNTPHAVCPKLNSTNPGVLVVEIPEGMNQSRAQQELCKAKSSIPSSVPYSVEAKFKQSITCSYAPSALAAYHVSRMLGGVGRAPVAVVRTMDADSHQSVIQKALSLLSGSPSNVIYKTWSQFAAANKVRSEPKIYTEENRKSLYGGLSENVKQEFIYTQVSGVGPYETRYPRFLQQVPFKRVANSASVEQIAGSTRLNAMLPVIQQMKDVSEMVLMDTLLAQDDRIGNIHFHLFKAGIEADGKMKKEKLTKAELEKVLALVKMPSRASEDELAQASAKLQSVLQNKILVRVMVLKDNDCGVDVDKRSNMMRNIDGIEQVRHMSPKTYKSLMAMAKAKNNGQLENFFLNTLLYRSKDFKGSSKSFSANLDKAASVLYQNCKSGALKLDLTDDFDSSGNWIAPEKTSCDL